jgi:hypothetical protein
MVGKQTPSLEGLIQPKGASRPSDVPQRGESAAAPVPASALAMPAASSPGRILSAIEPRTKSLTLRLSEGQYQRLRRFAFDRGASHQDVIEAALMAHLDKEGGR